MHFEVIKNVMIQLLLLSALMLAACGGKDAVAPEELDRQAYEDFREAIKEVIQDPGRQAEVLGLVNALQGDFQELREAVEVRRTELRSLNADYDATREQFQEYVDKYDTEIEAAHKRVMERHKAFVRATTAEEWDALQKADTKVMKSMVSAIQRI